METQSPNRRTLVGFAIGIIFAHLALNIAHGMAHGRLMIALDGFQKVFVGVVILAAPLVAGYLIWKGRLQTGGALLGIAMACSLIFGVYYHFILPGPDHVMHADLHVSRDWRDIFDFTAVILALAECLGVLAGARLFSKSEN